ncbi:MAG: zinc ribbon domain-containing protein [Candidatus Omnitrophica bacterium]|nr:zinc ribbon domain-containing protein [Candidatus Omnitrophota bacterium]
MPTYDYECTACGHTFELFQQMVEKPKKKCPQCGRGTLKRLIGAGMGIIFKGTGFYETDYKRKPITAPASSTGPAEKNSAASAPAAETKSDAGKEKKTESSASRPKKKGD